MKKGLRDLTCVNLSHLFQVAGSWTTYTPYWRLSQQLSASINVPTTTWVLANSINVAFPACNGLL